MILSPRLKESGGKEIVIVYLIEFLESSIWLPFPLVVLVNEFLYEGERGKVIKSK